MRHTPTPELSSGGFVMSFVMLMLFAISVTAVTGYIIVSSEFAMSNHAKEGSEVIAVAHGGLQRYLSEQMGAVVDSAGYVIGLSSCDGPGYPAPGQHRLSLCRDTW